jgi:hypothetical protein
VREQEREREMGGVLQDGGGGDGDCSAPHSWFNKDCFSWVMKVVNLGNQRPIVQALGEVASEESESNAGLNSDRTSSKYLRLSGGLWA